MRSLRGGLLLALTACAVDAGSSSAEPLGEVTQEIRAPQRSASGYPEAVTVKVNNSFNDFCTGVIVSPRVVLTAAHCIVFGASSWNVVAPFAAGGAQARTVPASSGEPLDAAFRTLTRSNFNDHPELRDLGFLVADPPFQNIPPPELSPSQYSPPAKVSAVGRQSETSTAGLVLSSAVDLALPAPGAKYGREYATPLLTLGGDSGGPLFVDGTHKLVGTERVYDDKDHWTELHGAVHAAILAKIEQTGGFVVVSPPAPKPPPRGSVAFTVAAGSGGPYTWALTSGPSGGSVDASGRYVAGATPGVTDVVTVTDGRGRSRSTSIEVGPGVSGDPASRSVAPRGTLTLKGAGGSGAGYVFAFETNASGGTLNGATYVAGSVGDVSDVVRITDGLGNVGTTRIDVGSAIAISPRHPSTPTSGKILLRATGGSGAGYAWSLTANPSGGSIAGAGEYQAGAVGPSVDVARVTDSLGNEASVEVAVGFPLTIRPGPAVVPPRGRVELVGIGGTGTGYVWAFDANASGASLDGEGVYVAGPTPNVTDVIALTDSDGTRVTLPQPVGPGVTIAPRTATLAPGKTLALRAEGGSGAGFTFAFVTNASGGALADATYTAGELLAAKDVVVARDSLGNEDRAEITIVPDGPVSGAPAAASGESGCSGAPGDPSALAGVAVALVLARRRRRV